MNLSRQSFIQIITIMAMATALITATDVAYAVAPTFQTTTNCTYSGQGYWKNHPEAWPVTSLEMGGQAYSQAELLEIFDTSPRGDATYILAHQLIAAKLNVAQGANDSAIASTIADADNWLTLHPLGSDPANRDGRSEGIGYSETLDDYNSGKVGPGSCDANGDDDPNGDLDGDGIVNSIEDNADANNDGNPDADADGDGTPNKSDADSDNDSIPDAIEGTGDADQDGIPNFVDTDSDGDGKSDADERVSDNDGDGLPNFLDADDNDGPNGDLDGDGLTNQQESDLGTDPNNKDSDNDGIFDNFEIGSDLNNPLNSDNDSLINALDPDDDNDGTNTANENPDPNNDGNPNDAQDSDGDNLPDYLDNDNSDGPSADSDGDGLTNQQESDLGTDPNSKDSDNDGLFDNFEIGSDLNNPLNSDNDTLINALDPDDDNDNINTANENPDPNNDGNPNDAQDSDVDNLPDYLDPNDNDGPNGDLDFDTIPNHVEDSGDADNDGTPDPDADGDGRPNKEDIDSDGDNLLDIIEGTDDSDGDGIPNYLDFDDDDGPDGDFDGDGLTNQQESDLGTNPNSKDSDNDGIFDNFEIGNDLNNPLNSDNDSLINALDPDDDNDNINTANENPDPNNDGNPDDAQDSDNNGTPDYLQGDTIAPTGSILINGGANESTQDTVLAQLSASDNVGVTEMLVSIDIPPTGPGWEAYTTEKTLTLSEGTHTVYVKYRDAAGNESPVYSAQITIINEALPARISINNGDIWTNSSDVSLKLVGPTYATSMKISNDGGLADSSWETYSLERNWTLDAIPNTTTSYTVYAIYKDAQGNLTAVVNDTIVYDPVPPVGIAEIDESRPALADASSGSSMVLSLNISAEDDKNGSGISQMRLSNQENFSDGTGWVNYSPTYDWVSPADNDLVYIQFSDKAGNESDPHQLDLRTAKASPGGSSGDIYLPIIFR